MNEGATKKTRRTDWSRLENMTDEEICANALSDPDNPPATGRQLVAAKRISIAKSIRWYLKLTQEEFSARYQIPLGTLRDWEQHRSEPDGPARAFLKAIRVEPEIIARALAQRPAAE